MLVSEPQTAAQRAPFANVPLPAGFAPRPFLGPRYTPPAQNAPLETVIAAQSMPTPPPHHHAA
jgi:hypothetical protein